MRSRYSFILIGALALTGCAPANVPQQMGGAGLVEDRSTVKYYAADWAKKESGSIDVLPQPSGGMQTFVSHLDYPAYLRQRHVTGVMLVRVSFDASGNVLGASVIRSVDRQLDTIVLRAVRDTRWTPAMKNGKPVPYITTFPITFGLGA